MNAGSTTSPTRAPATGQHQILSLIAYRTRTSLLRDRVTPDAVSGISPESSGARSRVHELPGLGALQFIGEGCAGRRRDDGRLASTRMAMLSAALLEMEIEVD